MLSCINRGVRKYVESFSPTIQGEKIVVMKWGDRYKYLRVPTGRVRLQSLEDLKRRITLQVEVVCESLLTDWKKVDAINTFIISQTTYYLRAACQMGYWSWFHHLCFLKKRSIAPKKNNLRVVLCAVLSGGPWSVLFCRQLDPCQALSGLKVSGQPWPICSRCGKGPALSGGVQALWAWISLSHRSFQLFKLGVYLFRE